MEEQEGDVQKKIKVVLLHVKLKKKKGKVNEK